MRRPTSELYYEFEVEVKKAIKDTAKKYRNLRFREPDYVYEFNVFALEGLLELDKYVEKERQTSDTVIRFLKGHLSKRAIDLWRKLCKPCRKCRKEKPRFPKVQPCGCIVGGPKWLPIDKDNPVFMSDISSPNWINLILTAEEKDLLEKWSAPEFREKYSSHKNIMKDVSNLCVFYDLDEGAVTAVLVNLYTKLKED